ncbi:MAG: site-specific DNA-methyltransferase [Phycisphaerae bacterium]|nr:site-specific DNA-methyltransferase [Phycisphaerae bacterium]
MARTEVGASIPRRSALATDAAEYGLVWPGRRAALAAAHASGADRFLAASGSLVRPAAVGHLLIEGDNLAALRLLQPTHAGRIKAIYIDPPYNTGADRLYADRFRGRRGLAPSARLHARWLSMMAPRLLLARDLLRLDGMIFISIDDNEVHNLRLLMNALFGEENFINTIVVKTKESSGASGGGADKKLKKNCEYLLLYARCLAHFRRTEVFQRRPLSALLDEKRAAGKPYEYRHVLLDSGRRTHVATLRDGRGQALELYRHAGHVVATIEQLANDERLPLAAAYARHHARVFRTTNAQTSIRTRVRAALRGADGLYSLDYVPASGRDRGQPVTKYFTGGRADLLVWLKDTSELQDGQVIKRVKAGTLWDDLAWTGIAREGGVDFPHGKKPVRFVRRILEIATGDDPAALVLDFFAGSGTTAQATLELNRADSGHRRFILIQSPEPTDHPAGPTIAAICQTRVQRVLAEFRAARPDTPADDLRLQVLKIGTAPAPARKSRPASAPSAVS